MTTNATGTNGASSAFQGAVSGWYSCLGEAIGKRGVEYSTFTLAQFFLPNLGIVDACTFFFFISNSIFGFSLELLLAFKIKFLKIHPTLPIN